MGQGIDEREPRRRAIAKARYGGLLTASLQATKAGAPIYERLGFADFGYVETWEPRG